MEGTDGDLPLGKPVAYVSRYSPSLLRSIDRLPLRRVLGIGEVLPFRGVDVWWCHELSWLNPKGRPEVAVVSLRVPCTSPCIAESKSMKLYLNSFSQTVFETRDAAQRTLASDLESAFGSHIDVDLHDVHQLSEGAKDLPGRSLDQLDVSIDRYEVTPELLRVEQSAARVQETLHTNLFRSVCPITHQPDWASVVVAYKGRAIAHEGLLAYLISFREHAAFHEHTIERMFVDILERCRPDRLSLYGLFLRRGGIDINPYRSTEAGAAPELRLPRQ